MVGMTPSLPSFSPTMLSPFSEKMTFVERVQNVYAGAYKIIFDIPSRTGPTNEALLRKYAPQFRYYTDIERLALLHIQTRHHLMDNPDVSILLSVLWILPDINKLTFHQNHIDQQHDNIYFLWLCLSVSCYKCNTKFYKSASKIYPCTSNRYGCHRFASAGGGLG